MSDVVDHWSRLDLRHLAAFADVAPADHLVPPRRIGLVWSRHRSMSPLHDRFVAITRAACDVLTATG